jgi:hypothetical protein
MATQEHQEEGNWSDNESVVSEYTPRHSSDSDMNSEPDLEQLDLSGPLAPPPPREDLLYGGPFASLQAAYDWC